MDICHRTTPAFLLLAGWSWMCDKTPYPGIGKQTCFVLLCVVHCGWNASSWNNFHHCHQCILLVCRLCRSSGKYKYVIDYLANTPPPPPKKIYKCFESTLQLNILHLKYFSWCISLEKPYLPHVRCVSSRRHFLRLHKLSFIGPNPRTNRYCSLGTHPISWPGNAGPTQANFRRKWSYCKW